MSSTRTSICRMRHASPNNSRHEVRLCLGVCDHYSIIDDGRCTCCGDVVKKVTKTNNTIKKFVHVCTVLRPILERWESIGDTSCTPSIAVKIDTWYYQVNLDWFKEFMDLKPGDRHDMFLARVKKNCPKVGALRVI